MTFFNDPVLQPDHAARGVAHGGGDARAIRGPGGDWRKRGHVLEFGIGIATGYATLGRIGFEGRYDYGAIGNAIILAARLASEAAARRDPRRARGRYAAAEDARGRRAVGERQLKGFSRPVRCTRSTAWATRRGT